MIGPVVFLFVLVCGLGCEESLYRTPDGSCNNVWREGWGSAGSPYLHLTSGGEVVMGDVELLVGGVESTYKPSHHPHVNALAAIWADFIYKDLSKPHSADVSMLDQQSAFLDGSGLYGSNRSSQNLIRGPNGTLSFQDCQQCHKDSGIGALYLVLFNEHNRLAATLFSLNPHWDSDRLFQESKKILTAEIQHITYNEFLPLILGKISWNGKNQRFYTGYSSSIQAGVFYEAALSVLHFLPTMIPESIVSTMTPQTNSTENVDEMKKLYDTIKSALNMPAQTPSLHFNTDNGYMDAVTLLRVSRAHTMASYVNVVNYCTGENIRDFSEMSSVNAVNQKWLATLYHRASEVDLLLGGILERIPHGALLGPTFQCILEKQFSLLRDGDRFWYENDLPPTSFTKGQLEELRKATLSSLLCENVKALRSVQPRSFIQEDPYLNSGVSCDHQTMFDLGHWKQSPDSVESKFEEEEAMVLSPEIIKNAIKRASEDLAKRQRQEYLIYTNQGIVDPKSPFGTAASFSKPNMMALNMANNSLLYEYASTELAANIKSQRRRRRQLDHDNVISFAPEFPVKDLFGDVDLAGLVPLRQDELECHEERGPCDPRSPYRSYTGHCNNLDRPNLGKSLTTFARLLPSVYENGISEPRILSVTGGKLPSPRLVSSMIHADISHLHTRYTLMLMQFAQFVDHDITFTPNHRGFFSSIPDCRSCDSPLTVHPECMPIPVPVNDPFYPQHNSTTGERVCLPFMRSLPGQQRLGSREQINQNSAYLDGSQIYGEHACMGRDLRGFGGRLNVTVHPSRGLKELLPVSPSHPECKAPSGYCFIAGDGRASEQPGLTALHTLYLREHNRLVEGLRSLNPHWSDEKLYQTSRKINTASYQHVIYNEFLPRLLGWNAINLYGLKLQNNGYYKGYSASCNPNVVTEFATAAYRIGHSLLRPHIPRMSPAFTPVDPPILLRDAFFNPDMIYQPHIIDEIMRGLVSTPMESLDQFITGEISNHLFEDRRVPHSGMDLPAMNIQRGRDHGIPPYNEYRALCNLKRASSWEDLSREIPGEVIARLRLIYPTVDDIDLFPGGLSERPLQGGLVGPTFACIIGLQFRQLRKCDRFWYESGDPLVRFTERQLGEIRKSTLSKMICDNLDTPSEIQRSAFEQPSDFLNPRVWCRGLHSIDLTAWAEEAQPGCKIGGRIVPIGESALPTPCTSCICTNHGGECASLRVTDCGRLLREAGRDAVLRDEVCAAQCATHLLDIGPPPPIDEIVSLTTRRPGRSREFPPPRRPRPPSLRKIVSELFLG